MPWPCGQQHRTVGSLTTPLSCSPFAFSGEPRGAACPAPLGDPPGHPATRPFGFAALLWPTGSRRTRGCAPQTCCDSFSRRPCATRPRKRDEPRCPLHHSAIWLTALVSCLSRHPVDSSRRTKTKPRTWRGLLVASEALSAASGAVRSIGRTGRSTSASTCVERRRGPSGACDRATRRRSLPGAPPASRYRSGCPSGCRRR